jgi:hypothetical protein
LNKFSAKQEKRRNSAFKLFRRSPASNQSTPTSNPTQTIATTSMNLVDTVSKAVNLVDQSLSNNSLINSTFLSLTSSPSSASNLDSSANNRPFSPTEFTNCLTRLVSSSLVSSTSPEANILFSASSVNTYSEKLSAITEQSSALAEFEEQFRVAFPQLYQDLMKQLKQFVDKFLDAAYRRKDSNSPLANNNTKQSEIIQEFYKKIYKYIQTSASIKSFLDKLNAFIDNSNMNGSFSDAANNKTSGNNTTASNNNNNNNSSMNNPNESIGDNLYEAIMIMVESFINNNIYDFVFPSIMTEFEEQDMELQKRIRGFYWITNEMIGTCIDENSIFFRDAYEEALNCKEID